ncbi:MAG TPA: ATP-dependent helicase [Mycobacteriales bacterium]|nr:ATP-dependent helicase [Mycobacteriales bacterium]
MFDRLTDEQAAAVTHTGGPLLVVAGAGTGKTATLSARVRWLTDPEGGALAPERVLLLTFTRRAAREMLGRVAAAGGPGGRVTGGTFHAIAHRLLRCHGSALGLPEGFTLLDAADTADVLDVVRTDLGFSAMGSRFPRKSTLADAYQRVIALQQPLADVVSEHYPWCAQVVDEMNEVFRGYLARKRDRGLVDLDDLLLLWRAALRDASLGPFLADAWDHVLVDEYQDVNALQVDIVRALCPPAELTAVGDDAQAVYGFRASSPEHVTSFADDFPGAETLSLTVNHRSTQPLLDVANAVTPRGLTAARGGGSRPTLTHCRDAAAEASAIAERVLAAREHGVLLRDQAVLARSGTHLAALELELARRHVPFVKYGGLRHLEAAHVKDLLAVLRLADNPRDDIAWHRVLQLLEGVGPATARQAAESVDPLAPEVLPWQAREAAGALAEGFREAHRGLPAGVRAERLRAALEPALRMRYQDAEQRLADLDALVASLAADGHTGADRSDRPLADLVAELTLDPPQSASEVGAPFLDEDWLVLSTVHSAKGLEWEVVHLLHASDGAFPSDMACGSASAIAEEQRLFYVALTRARRELHVTVPRHWYHRPRGRDDAFSVGKKSRFLTDAVMAGFDVIDLAGPDDDRILATAAPTTTIAVELDALFT